VQFVGWFLWGCHILPGVFYVPGTSLESICDCHQILASPAMAAAPVGKQKSSPSAQASLTGAQPLLLAAA
jgi:hypothetical protein